MLANYQIHAIYFLSSYFCYFVFNSMWCCTGVVQCLQSFGGAVCRQNLGGAGAVAYSESKSVHETFLVPVLTVGPQSLTDWCFCLQVKTGTRYYGN